MTGRVGGSATSGRGRRTTLTGPVQKRLHFYADGARHVSKRAAEGNAMRNKLSFCVSVIPFPGDRGSGGEREEQWLSHFSGALGGGGEGSSRRALRPLAERCEQKSLTKGGPPLPPPLFHL